MITKQGSQTYTFGFFSKNHR